MKNLKSSIFVLLLSTAMIHCQNNDSTGNKNKTNDKGSENQTENVEINSIDGKKIYDLSVCKKLNTPNSIQGNWVYFQEVRNNDGSTGSYLLLIQFSKDIMTLSALNNWHGQQCQISGKTTYNTENSTLKTKSDIYTKKEMSTENKENDFECNINFQKGEFPFEFDGGCLVLTKDHQTATLIPFPLPKIKETTNEHGGSAPGWQPEPTRIPTPSIPVPDDQYLPEEASYAKDAVKKVCKSYLSIDTKVTCLSKLNSMYYLDPFSVKVCNNYLGNEEIERCLHNLNGVKLLSETSKKVCDNFLSVSNKESCVKDFDHLVLDSNFESVCQEYLDNNKVKSCLISHSNKVNF